MLNEPFYLPDGKVAAISAGPTIDNQIIKDLFSNVITASHVLHKDVSFSGKLKVAGSEIPPNQIDSAGRLMEWLKPFKETEPHHRHMSPVWGLYPGDEISLSKTPKVAEAAKQLIISRGDESTGWSQAWKISLWARLLDGNHAYKLLKDQLQPDSQHGPTSANLFDMINGKGSPFQIDANFGVTAGIAEMLVQSQNRYIQFLPALPDQWPDRAFSGFCVRGGGVVSAQWQNGQLQ